MSPVCNSPHRTDDTNFEKVPLIPKPKEKLYKLKSHFERGHTKKLTYYNSESLLQWQALFQIVGVAFADWCIMRNVLILAVISLVCGVSVVLGLDRMKLDMMKFEVQYLNSARPFFEDLYHLHARYLCEQSVHQMVEHHPLLPTIHIGHQATDLLLPYVQR